MAHTYCVTFRIANKTVAGKTYDERREALIASARAENLGFWEETTSFMLVESDLYTSALARRLVEGLSKKDDILFIFDPSDKSGNYFGPIEYADVLRSFFPKAKSL
ncbi:hypothetical protein [Ancylobacter sp.]|uniref:hypothetical protein n=1 Tax=Ancylobacter sp. TaxID=1872567 RepID=UPI003C79B940